MIDLMDDLMYDVDDVHDLMENPTSNLMMWMIEWNILLILNDHVDDLMLSNGNSPLLGNIFW